MSCGVGHRCGSDPMLLWLWHKPAAAALNRPLAWESPYAMSASPKKPPPQKNPGIISYCLENVHFFLFFFLKKILSKSFGELPSPVKNYKIIVMGVLTWGDSCVFLFCSLPSGWRNPLSGDVIEGLWRDSAGKRWSLPPDLAPQLQTCAHSCFLCLAALHLPFPCL